MRARFPALALALTVMAVGAGCDRPPSADGLKEWTPSDHDGEKKTGAPGAPGEPGSANQGPRGDAGGAPALVELAWRQQCSTCHGSGGRGDGPQGALFKATDFTGEEWQSKISDPDIAKAIRDGKGRMPKFDLPDAVVSGLVARIRSVRGK